MRSRLWLKSQLIYFSKKTTLVKYCFFTVINQQLPPRNRFILIFSYKWQTSFSHIQCSVANLMNWKHVTSLSLTVHAFFSRISQCFLYYVPACFLPPSHYPQEPSLHAVLPWPAVTVSDDLCGTPGQGEMTICPDPQTRTMSPFPLQRLTPSRKAFSACASPPLINS